MKTIEEMDEELGSYMMELRKNYAYHPNGCTIKICKLEDQRNEVVAQRDKALDLLREIVEVSHEHIVTSVLQRARELLNRKEGQ